MEPGFTAVESVDRLLSPSIAQIHSGRVLTAFPPPGGTKVYSGREFGFNFHFQVEQGYTAVQIFDRLSSPGREF